MNVHPIERAARQPIADAAAQPGQERETLVQQSAALARQLADVMLANVQNTASLNLTAARALLAHARIPAPANLQQRSDTWRYSWRSFEVCATSADQMLNLTRGHVERTTSALWRATERLVDEMQQLDGAHVVALRETFAAMRAAQAAYWEATRQVHQQLVDLVRAPLPSRVDSAGHGAH
jgi:hypothetical protein